MDYRLKINDSATFCATVQLCFTRAEVKLRPGSRQQRCFQHIGEQYTFSLAKLTSGAAGGIWG